MVNTTEHASPRYFVKGKLKPTGDISISFAINVRFETDNHGSGEIYIPSQGVFGAELTDVYESKGEISFKFGISSSQWRCRFEDGSATCAVNRNGQSIACDVALISEQEYKAATSPRRPQTPEPPYPYKTEDFTVARGAIELAGTLTIPENPHPSPAIVLLSGSGAQDRDSTIHWHRPFFIIADYLSRQGIAVLRMDDRGIGRSSGQLKDTSIKDLADDAEAMIAKLGEIEHIDSDHIGILGHSLGAGVGSIAASKSRSVAFLVMLAGPGLDLQSVMIQQARSAMMMSGAGDSLATDKAKWLKELYLALEKPEAKLRRNSVSSILERDPAAKKGIDRNTAELLAERAIDTEMMRSMVSFVPWDFLSKIRIPVLAINGSLDIQVDARNNLSAIESALQSANNPDYEIKEIIGVNHLFQPAESGLSNEYGEIEETIRPDVLDLIALWIQRHVNR